jgi:hypothetical protein
VSKGHLGTVKVEEIHQLHCPSFPQGGKVDSLRLVIQLELDREDLDVFYASAWVPACRRRQLTQEGLSRRFVLHSRQCNPRNREAEEALQEIQRVLVDVQLERKDLGLLISFILCKSCSC